MVPLAAVRSGGSEAQEQLLKVPAILGAVKVDDSRSILHAILRRFWSQNRHQNQGHSDHPMFGKCDYGCDYGPRFGRDSGTRQNRDAKIAILATEAPPEPLLRFCSILLDFARIAILATRIVFRIAPRIVPRIEQNRPL